MSFHPVWLVQSLFPAGQASSTAALLAITSVPPMSTTDRVLRIFIVSGALVAAVVFAILLARGIKAGRRGEQKRFEFGDITSRFALIMAMLAIGESTLENLWSHAPHIRLFLLLTTVYLAIIGGGFNLVHNAVKKHFAMRAAQHAATNREVRA